MADRREGVSPQTDELAATLLGEALDVLAVGEIELGVVVAVQDESGEVQSFTFDGDGEEACLEGARAQVGAVPGALRYAIAYEGAVEVDGAYADAVLLEFGERGWRAYSAFSLVDGKGSEDTFAYTDPAPAGEMEPLL